MQQLGMTLAALPSTGGVLSDEPDQPMKNSMISRMSITLNKIHMSQHPMTMPFMQSKRGIGCHFLKDHLRPSLFNMIAATYNKHAQLSLVTDPL